MEFIVGIALAVINYTSNDSDNDTDNNERTRPGKGILAKT
jgi:hypothetical protein